MKKSLLLLTFSLSVSFSLAQTLYVKELTEVKVKPGALLYVDGDMKVESGAASRANNPNAGYVSNEGNIKITKTLTMGNRSNGTDFVNELLPNGVYGQLIVKNGTADKNDGVISSRVVFNKPFGFYPFAVPYTGPNSSAAYLLANILNKTPREVLSYFRKYAPSADAQFGFDRERYKNPLFVWENNGDPMFQELWFRSDGVQYPTLGSYVALNASFDKLPDLKNLKSTLQGTPNKDDVSVTVTRYKVSNNKAYNHFGEQYGSYVFDFTKAMPAGFNHYGEKDAVVEANGFGDNIFLLGNPFTSNINLFGDASNTTFKNNDVMAIVQFDSGVTYNTDVNLESNTGDISTSYGGEMNAVTGNGTGDAQALYVRPYQTFAVKLGGATSGKYTFNFTDGMKTFDLPTGGAAPVNSVLDALARRSDVNGTGINQVGLDLYNAADKFTGVKTYVVASDIYEASKKGKGVELANISIQDKDTALYTLQEDEKGNVDANLASEKEYINGVNANKYVGKPIHLVLQNGNGTYTLKARLNSDLAKNKNSFYFEDKKAGKVIKVNKDFKYTFNAKGTDKDRFVLYWAKTPVNALDKEVAKEVAEQSNVVVYKAAEGVYKVRFNKSSKKADVFVYNISGQLVNVAKGINTAEDYIVPIKGSSSVYIVKVVDENGKITTQKIIK